MRVRTIQHAAPPERIGAKPQSASVGRVGCVAGRLQNISRKVAGFIAVRNPRLFENVFREDDWFVYGLICDDDDEDDDEVDK